MRTKNIKSPNLLNTLLENHWRYGKIQVWLFVKKYTLSLSKRLQTVTHWEDWTRSKKNEMESTFSQQGEEVNEVREIYGWKSLYCPLQIKELSAFENELYNLLKIINSGKNC